MKKITMFTIQSCPYCQKARKWMKEILESDEKYREIPLTVIDELEEPEISAKFDYNYVPTYYIDDEKVHDGAATFEMVKKIFDDALIFKS